MYKKILYFTCIMLILTTNGYAESTCISSVNMSKLREAIGHHSEFYGDIPNRIDCSNAKQKQKIICKTDVLRFMERLDHIASFYGYENATKQELDHSKPFQTEWLNQMLNKCHSPKCMCQNYKEHTSDLLGSINPY